MNHYALIFTSLCLIAPLTGSLAETRIPDELIEDRIAIERVYHANRINSKGPLESVLTREQTRQLVARDLLKESVFAEHYGYRITGDMLEAEIRRIETTTRAPAMLEQIKQALNYDPERFSRAFVRPIIVERLLRAHFDDDAEIHAARRNEAVRVREALLGGSSKVELREVTWSLTEPDEQAPVDPSALPDQPLNVAASSKRYEVDATIQFAKVLASKESHSRQNTFYFSELHPQLQQILNQQLRVPGDVSAVVEMGTRFHVFVLRERNHDLLKAGTFSISKESYHEWLDSKEETPS